MQSPLRCAWSVVALLAAFGCVGQSGGEILCATHHHCMCETDFSQHVRGTITAIDGDSVVLTTTEIPDRTDRWWTGTSDRGVDRHTQLRVGMSIGGTLVGCTTPPPLAVGMDVIVFNYFAGSQNGPDCPEFHSCVGVCETEPTNDQYLACAESCIVSLQEACSAHDAEAWLHGTLRVGIESDGVLDLGTDMTGPARIPLAELPSIAETSACDARFAPPPPPAQCGDPR